MAHRTNARPGPGPLDAYGTSRLSPLLPGVALVHADLHNHTWLSDGAGDPGRAFDSMRSAGLDVAAITDHATMAVDRTELPPWNSIDDKAWERLAELAEEAHDDGTFVAFRGFEWSHSLLGHMNVWGSPEFVNPFRSDGPSILPFLEWLSRPPTGGDSLVSFNHPGGRHTARFEGFRFHQPLVDRLVAIELFNKVDDYLFEGTDLGRPSPLLECLASGWRPALIGVTDEHGEDWGFVEGKGRTGLYVRELTRDGVREALLARRAFATRRVGLRLAVTVGGTPMGGTLRHRRGRVDVAVDLDLGAAGRGSRCNVQVLRPGDGMPVVAAAADVRAPAPGEPVITLPVDLDADDGDWVVVRVTDPSARADRRARGEYATLGDTVAYASPVWLDPS